MGNDADLDWARSRAQELLTTYGIQVPEDIHLEAIAYDNRVEVRRAPLPGCEARLIRWPNRGRITVDDSHGIEGRTRFSIGHELGHWFLHPHLDQRLWQSTTEQIHGYRGSREEQEANAFSAELLLPSSMIRPMAQQFAFGFPLVDRVATRFQASVTATALALCRQSKEQCAVILADGYEVLWSVRNPKLSDWSFHVAKGSKLSDETKAWACPCEGDQEMSIVPAAAWFPNCRHPSRLEVWEASRDIADFGVVLTLLSVSEQ